MTPRKISGSLYVTPEDFMFGVECAWLEGPLACFPARYLVHQGGAAARFSFYNKPSHEADARMLGLIDFDFKNFYAEAQCVTIGGYSNLLWQWLQACSELSLFSQYKIHNIKAEYITGAKEPDGFVALTRSAVPGLHVIIYQCPA